MFSLNTLKYNDIINQHAVVCRQAFVWYMVSIHAPAWGATGFQGCKEWED